MAGEIRASYPTGSTLYAVKRNSSGQVYYIAGEAFEAWGGGVGRTANDYGVELTDYNGEYIGDNADFTNLPAGIHKTVIYLQAGGSPADEPTDTMLFGVESQWDGSAEMTPGDRVIDEIIEGAFTVRHILRLILAAIGGISNGGGTVPLNFRDQADGKNRIQCTVDAAGNRSATTLDGT